MASGGRGLFDPWLRVHERVGGEIWSACTAVDGIEAPSPTGRTGRSSSSRRRPLCRSRARWRRSSRSRTDEVVTSSPTSGCTTRSRPGAARARPTARRARRAPATRPPPDRASRGAAARRRPAAEERAALAERSLEARLLPRRLVAAPPRGTPLGERAGAAPRHPRQAHRRPEVEERLQRVRPECVPRALLDPRDIRVHRQHRLAVRLVPDCSRGVRADAGKLGQVVGPALRGDRRCAAR